MKPTKRVSLVLPTMSNFQMLADTIGHLLPTLTPEDEFIFIDNGSSDETSKYLASMQEKMPEGFVTIVTNAENEGFCTATNQGMAKAQGKYICWINDDVVPYPGWIEKLIAPLQDDYNHPFHSNLGLTGPLSNYVGGSQLVPLTPEQQSQISPSSGAELDKEMEKVAGDSMPLLDTFLSGFCLMMKREVYDSIGGIDEVFSPGGFCDNDFVLRATQAGFGAIVIPTCFIFHYGSVTLNKVAPELAAGTDNWHTFFGKHKTDRSVQKKLVMNQRIQINTEHDLALFKRCLARNLELVDGVVIVDDKSTLVNQKILKELCGDKLVRYTRNAKNAPLAETQDRLLAQQGCFDVSSTFEWACCFDHDECFAADVTRERLQRLMNPISPTTWAYDMMFNNYWRSDDLIRIDQSWGSMLVTVMWRNDPLMVANTLRPKLYKGDVGLHSGRAPQGLPQPSRKVCTLTVDHFGYTDIVRNKQKKDYYEAIDTSPDWLKKELVGPNGYDHLTNERGLELAAPCGTTVAANVMVKNEQTHLGHLLMAMDGFFDELIICDTGSMDNTLGYLNEAGVPYVEKKMEDNFADIRNYMIDLSTSEYIFHLDADEVPHMGALAGIVASMRLGCDGQSVHLHSIQKTGEDAPTEQPRLFKNNGILRYAGRVHETLELSMKKFEKSINRPPQGGNMDIHFTNRGYLRDDARIDVKLNYYAKLLRLEIEENPRNFKAMCELAAHERNIRNYPECERLLLECVKIDPDYLPASRDLIMLHVKRAFDVVKTTEGKNFENPDIVRQLQSLHHILSPLAPQQGVGTAAHCRGEQAESYKNS